MTQAELEESLKILRRIIGNLCKDYAELREKLKSDRKKEAP